MTLGDLLHKILEQRGLSYAAFARSVGVKPPLVFAVRKGKQRIPKARIEQWAEGLGLKGKDRTKFLEEAWLGHAPTYVKAMVDQLRRELSRRTKSKPPAR